MCLKVNLMFAPVTMLSDALLLNQNNLCTRKLFQNKTFTLINFLHIYASKLPDRNNINAFKQANSV